MIIHFQILPAVHLPQADDDIVALLTTYGLRISASVYMYIYIYSCGSRFCPGGQRHVFKMASLAVTGMPSSNL